MAEKTNNCVFCPEFLKEYNAAFRDYSMSELRIHMAVVHVDSGTPTDDFYECDGASIRRGECSAIRKFKTLASSEYVRHMEELHSNQVLPFNIRYKAAMADLMLELSVPDTGNQPTDLTQLLALLLEPSTPQDDQISEAADSEPSSTPNPRAVLVELDVNKIANESDSTAKTAELVSEQPMETESNAPESTNTAEMIVGEQVEAVPIQAARNDRDDSNSGTAAIAVAPAPVIASVAQSPLPEGATTSRSNASAASGGLKKRSWRKASVELRDIYKKINNRRRANAEGGPIDITCKICEKAVQFRTAAQGLSHALVHLACPLFVCLVCGKQCGYYTAWRQHFDHSHLLEKNSIAAGVATYADFYIDNRDQFETEITRKFKECYDE